MLNIKTLKQVRLERNFFKMLVFTHGKSTSSITGERLLFLYTGNNTRLTALTIFIQHSVDSTVSAIWQEKEIKFMQSTKEEIKVFLSADDIFLSA